MNITELRQEKAKLITDARALLEKSETEKRELNSDEDKQWKTMLDDADGIQKKIDREERQADLDRTISQGSTTKPERTIPAGQNQTDEQRQAATDKETRTNWGQYFSHGETRNLEAGLDTAGGFLSLPQVVVGEMIRAVDDNNVIRGLARKFTIDAESLGAPTLTKPSDATWTPELLTGDEDTTMAFGKRELRPHPLAKRIKISRKLLRQSRIDPVGLVSDEFGIVIGNTEEKTFMTGTLNNQPLGVFTASDNGISTSRDVSTANTTSSIVVDNLYNVKYTLKAAYWGSARWIFHRDAVLQIAKLKDGEGRYLLNVDTNQLLGFPMVVSENAPNTFTTGLYVGLLGDFRFYWIVDSLLFEMQRLDELYAATNQVGFIVRKEVDGAPVLEEAFVRVKLG